MALQKRAEGNQLPDNLMKVGREVDTCTVHMLRTSILSADQLYLNVSYLHVTSVITRSRVAYSATGECY